jgi:DNA-binding CsgD family transcriptional regulator
MDAILRPLDSCESTWLTKICHCIKALTRADHGSVVLRVGERVQIHCTDLPADASRPYAELSATMDRRFAYFRRGLGLGVYLRDMVWPDLDAFYASEYYNEFIVPVRLYDALGIMVTAGHSDEWIRPTELLVHHERSSGPRFGEHGLGLFRLLRPAFEAAVRNRFAFAAHRDEFARAVDVLADGVLVCDDRARVLHRNAALALMISRELQPEKLHDAMESVARTLARMLVGNPSRMADGVGAIHLEIVTRGARYSVRGNLLGPDVMGGNARMLVALARETPALPDVDDVRARFGLTARQARVALLLAQAFSNQQIATCLGISPHTARHHTEQVLLKLTARSRAEVGPLLLR